MIDFYTSYKVNITGQYSYRTDFDEFQKQEVNEELYVDGGKLLEILKKCFEDIRLMQFSVDKNDLENEIIFKFEYFNPMTGEGSDYKYIIKQLNNLVWEVNMKEEKEFYSIGRGSLNLNGKFYYGLDYAITDFMRSLEEENKSLQSQLKEKEEVIKEAREYARKEIRFVNMQEYHKLDEILSKGENK